MRRKNQESIKKEVRQRGVLRKERGKLKERRNRGEEGKGKAEMIQEKSRR